MSSPSQDFSRSNGPLPISSHYPDKRAIQTVEPVSDKLDVLLSIHRRFSSEERSPKKSNRLLSVIAGEAARLIGAERAIILVRDSEKGQLSVKIGPGAEESVTFGERLGIAGATLSAGVSLIVEEVFKSPFFDPAVDSRMGAAPRNILSVPLRNASLEIAGILQVMNKKKGKFDLEDQQFLEALAVQAGLLLENTAEVVEWMPNVDQRIAAVEAKPKRRGLWKATAKQLSIRALVEKAAKSTLSVLVTGENGTGKELVARSLHDLSDRRSKSYVAVNCAALPEALVESELFGIEKGVATGVESRIGRIEAANGGTLFLDEIGDLSLVAQAKLLRVLQEREVDRVGGRNPVAIDVRVVAATNKDLKKEIREGRFRQDLYFRLNVIHVQMPPLRQMRSDIEMLALHFLKKFSDEIGRPKDGFSNEALRALTIYDWPGNIRELENEVVRAIVLSSGNQIELKDLSTEICPIQALETGFPVKADAKVSLKEHVMILETQMIRDVMTQTQGDKIKAAKLLGLSPQGLKNKLKRYDWETGGVAQIHRAADC